MGKLQDAPQPSVRGYLSRCSRKPGRGKVVWCSSYFGLDGEEGCLYCGLNQFGFCCSSDNFRFGGCGRDGEWIELLSFEHHCYHRHHIRHQHHTIRLQQQSTAEIQTSLIEQPGSVQEGLDIVLEVALLKMWSNRWSRAGNSVGCCLDLSVDGLGWMFESCWQMSVKCLIGSEERALSGLILTWVIGRLRMRMRMMVVTMTPTTECVTRPRSLWKLIGWLKGPFDVDGAIRVVERWRLVNKNQLSPPTHSVSTTTHAENLIPLTLLNVVSYNLPLQAALWCLESLQ